ncbi:MAG: NUDIX domain-containing protein [Verrucomicrobia bacterium]|jgi:mutator protein MutT|nr:NUDIX domain-containing protein [Verrucomicrobiota bacterium]
MKPFEAFNFCPSCGKSQPPPEIPCLICAACEFTYFFNPTIAAAGLILNEDGNMLFIERAKEPGKGKLAFVGGFMDAGEIAEEALEREIHEEVGLKVQNIQYVGNFPNSYHYKNITYPVLDFFFTATCTHTQAQLDLSEVANLHWLNPNQISGKELAFESMRRAFDKWKSGRS